MIHSRSAAVLTALAASIWLPGCSTPPTPAEDALASVPAPEIQRDLPLEQPDPVVGRLCKLGESCVAMDSRPFEACLVATRHCVDKAVEPIPAGTPKESKAEGPVKVSR